MEIMSLNKTAEMIFSGKQRYVHMTPARCWSVYVYNACLYVGVHLASVWMVGRILLVSSN
jgi:hypothetical protein